MKILIAFFLFQPLLSVHAASKDDSVPQKILAQKANSQKKGKYTVPTKEELKQKLTKLQYDVTQRDKTEPPFKNEYWDNKEEGIYVDIVSGEPLFSSTHKYKSGTGWPSFYQPIEKEVLVNKEDKSLFLRTRTEVRSKNADSHLGHVFDDGPAPTGKRFCINSASLKFIPKAKMKELGFEKYLILFDQKKEEAKK